MKHKIVRLIIALMICGWGTLAWAETCPKVEETYRSALRASDKTRALEQVVSGCPGHVKALNDLALAYEEEHRLADAEAFYRKAIQADSDFPPPYAGLGDVLVATGSSRQAANAYKGFIRLLAKWKKRGDPEGYARYESVYQKRLATVMAKLSSGGPVSADTISRSLSRSFVPGTSRGLEVVPMRAEIDLSIHFNFGSAALLPKAMDQLDQVAKAFRGEELRDARVEIEGHTDSKGSERDNLILSQKRADAVRLALMSRGIEGKRMESVGRGESFPVADNATNAGRALNRRVTFVNMGQK